MRFKSRIRNVSVFAKICASLSSLHSISWLRLNDEAVQFTVIPDKGSQVWSVLKIESLFDQYHVESAANNVINLEVPIQALHRALKSAIGASEASLRLTKKDNVPILCLTINTTTFTANNGVVTADRVNDEYGDFDFDFDLTDPTFGGSGPATQERQTIITQDISVKVLTQESVQGLHEPRLREADVYIHMPNLAHLKSISEKFTKLAMSTAIGTTKNAPRLELRANMHGSMKIAVKTDALSISSVWSNLAHPQLDANHVEGGVEGVQNHPTTRMKELGGPNGENEAGWAKVRIDAKDWSRVLSVGRVSSRVIGGFVDDTALVMYCWIGSPDDEEESCLTYFISSFSA